MFFAVELVNDRQQKTPAPEQAEQIMNLMKQQGVLISRIGIYDNILKLRPPMPFQPEHADLLLETLDRVFQQVCQLEALG